MNTRLIVGACWAVVIACFLYVFIPYLVGAR